MYEGQFFVIEGAETGNRLGRFGAKDVGEAFDDAHEDVFTGDPWCLMPEVYCYMGVGDTVALGIRSGYETSASIGCLYGTQW